MGQSPLMDLLGELERLEPLGLKLLGAFPHQG